MSSSKDTQAAISHSSNGHRKSQKADTPLIDTFLPNPLCKTKEDISTAPKKSEVEYHPSRMASALYPSPPTSPSTETDSTRKEEKSAANGNQVEVSSLKTKLGLDKWQCGSLTQKNTPCSRSIGKEKQDQINSQIESMISLTWSCPELETELHKLVMLVHCHQHDCGSPKDSRVESWVTAFPDKDGNPKPAPSIEKQIRKALGCVSTKCVGTTADHKRCKREIGGRKVQNRSKTIDEIVKPEVYLDDVNVDGFLRVLETNMYCHLHVNRRPLKYLAEWKLSLLKIRTEVASKVVQSIEFDALGPEPSKISIGDKVDIVLPTQEILTPKISQAFSEGLDQDPTLFWPEDYDTTAFDIIARGDPIADYASSYEVVRREIMRPLDKVDQQKGFVYLYEVEGNSGFVKLGYTGRSLAERHKEWDFACNRIVKVLYPKPGDCAIAVPHASRVETLCHAELDHRKIRIYCKGCLKQHLEWFEIPSEEAIAVIRKWSKWINTSPYRAPRLRSGSHWTLEESESQRASDIDRFMNEISLDSQ